MIKGTKVDCEMDKDVELLITERLHDLILLTVFFPHFSPYGRKNIDISLPQQCQPQNPKIELIAEGLFKITTKGYFEV